MINNNLGLYSLNNSKTVSMTAMPPKTFSPQTAPVQTSDVQLPQKTPSAPIKGVQTTLNSQKDVKMYNEILTLLATSKTEKVSPEDDVLRQNKLDALLKSGVLLNRDSNDKTSVLENIHKTITSERMGDMDPVKVAGQLIDTLYDPAIITQTFGDIPNEAMVYIDPKDAKYLKEARALDAEGSGTCVAASVEYSMAHRRPAEFARWAEGLTSESMSVNKDLQLSSLSSNTMDAVWLLNNFNTSTNNFDFSKANITIKPDSNALVRAKIQDKFWNKGERNIVDVMFQSALMNLGSQHTYDSLTDTRAGSFAVENQGLVEFEKTYIESVAGDKERMSVVYQNMDENQVLNGSNYDAETIKNHIKNALDSGEDVIIGCVVTASDCKDPQYHPNKVMGGHEMTITGYSYDKNGKMQLICNDTDDNKSVLLEYSADALIPKIHHASYDVDILEEQ